MEIAKKLQKQLAEECEEVKLNKTLQQLLTDAKGTEKLCLVHFYNASDRDNTFLSLLSDKNVNYIFTRYFHVLALNVELLESLNVLHALDRDESDPDDLIGMIILGKVLNTDCIQINTIIDPSRLSPDEIIFELHEYVQIYENLLQDLAVENCSKPSNFLCNLNLEHVTFKQAIDLTFRQPFVYLRKIMMLYIYRSESKLCCSFNKYLINNGLGSYSRFLVPIVWEANPAWKAQLAQVCDEYFGEKVITDCLDSTEGGIFFIIPTDRNGDVIPTLCTSITTQEQCNSRRLQSMLDSLCESFENCNKITDRSELEAIKTFGTPFFREKLLCDSLNNIIEICLSNESKKMLLFYMGSSSSELWITLVNEMKSILQHDTNVLLFWDTTNTQRNEALKLALQRAFNMEKMQLILEQQLNALFVFVPLGNSLFLHTFIDSRTKSVTRKLKEAHQFFMFQCVLPSQHSSNSGAIIYQQIMCEGMGDRNYDCFQLQTEEIHLKKKIAFAYFGPPEDESGNYDESQEKTIIKATTFLKSIASKYGENEHTIYISFMRVCLTPLPKEKLKKIEKGATYDSSSDYIFVPFFGIQKCRRPEGHGIAGLKREVCRLFVDHTGRTYKSWMDYLEDNRYPKMLMIVPKNGRYTMDHRNSVELEILPTPACGIGPAILKGFDIGTGVVGGIAGGAFFLTTFVAVPFLPIVAATTAAGMGIYGISRSIYVIVDRATHKESMSLTEAEARAAYLNIIAGSLCFVTAGASAALAAYARTGATIGLGIRASMNGLTVLNVAAGSAAITNSVYDFATNLHEDPAINALQIIQLTSAILFFGHSVYNIDSANTVINRAQATALSEFMDSLGSNRMRKSFNRLVSETVNGAGNVQAGQAEVISYIRNLNDPKGVIRILTRNGKMLSKHGVRFSVKNDQILFNNVEMNVMDFANLSKAQRIDALSSLPSAPSNQRPITPLKSSIRLLDVYSIGTGIYNVARPIFQIFIDNNLSLEEKVSRIVKQLSEYTQQLIASILYNFLMKIRYTPLFKTLEDMFSEKMVANLLDMLFNFLLKDTATCELQNMSVIERAVVRFKCFLNDSIKQLEEYCTKWVVAKIVTNDCPDIQKTRESITCSECGGICYSK